MTVDPAGQVAEVARMVPVGRDAGRERRRIAGLAAAVVLLVAAYLLLKSFVGGAGDLLPFQMLARDLTLADQETFAGLKERVLALEVVRARTGRWPDPDAAPGFVQEGAAAASHTWRHAHDGLIVNYLGRPRSDDSSAAWLVVYREPDPSAPTDTAPNDEEHHRLPDGTVLHVSIWTRRFGGQVSSEFVRQPEVAGWTQILVAPLDRRAPLFGPARPR